MTQSIVSDIVKAVSEVDGIDPLELDYRLTDHVDVDAIQALVNHDNASFTLTFELPDHKVTVTEDGTVLVNAPNSWEHD